MNIIIPILSAGIFILASDSTAAKPTSEQEEDMGYSFSDKVVLAYYYIWFAKGWFDGTEGNAGNALEDIHPILGSYDSYDPHIIEEHMKMAKRAKIDAFAVSWWFDPSKNGMNDRLRLVFEKALLHDFKIAALIEADGRSMDQIKKCLRYYLTKYHDHKVALKVEGKPVVLIWGTNNYKPEEWQKAFNQLQKEGLPSAFYLVSGQMGYRYLGPFKCLESYVTVDVNDDSLPSYYAELRRRVDKYNKTHLEDSVQWHATIMPSFDEREIPGRQDTPEGAGWKERNNGEYYRRSFKAAIASKPDWLRITSFNELAEHTYIEPTEEFGWTYIDMTAEFVDMFKHPERMNYKSVND